MENVILYSTNYYNLDDTAPPDHFDEMNGEDSDPEDLVKSRTEILNRPQIMQNLIGAINKIQDAFNTLKVPNSIELPQIVMLGSQSAGKSSVLESIVHRPFLPRGSDIVTRCPLILQLIECKMNDTKHRRAENGTTKIEEWGEFLHLKNKVFSDFDKIRKEIEKQTDKLTASSKGISDKPINLKIYSPNVVNLTLVDLPGITKNPIGDQPKDIEAQVKNLVMEYIKNEKSIILSVSAANADIATSDSLKYAKMVDPNGDRTLAILTKIDIMDKGTDARDMLSGKLIPVKLGIIGVINRSQQDIKDNKTIDEQLMNEQAFFEENYKDMAENQGIPYLSKRLSDMLMIHIQKCLPDLKKEIAIKLGHFNEILDSCGKEVKDRDDIIFEVVSLMASKFSEIINGTATMPDDGILTGGPKFREIFDESFEKALNDVKVDIEPEDIIKYISTHGGPRLSVFAPENLFEKLVFDHIEFLRDPSIECVEECHEEMEKVILMLIKDRQVNLTRFPNLEITIHSILKNTLDSCLFNAKYSVNELIGIELSSINTDHPDFDKILKNFVPVTERDRDGDDKLKIEQDAETIDYLVKQYFPIVKETVKDQVPKIVMFKIINCMKKELQKVLLKQLFKEDENEMLEECKENSERRENAKAMAKALKVAKKTIEDIEMGY